LLWGVAMGCVCLAMEFEDYIFEGLFELFFGHVVYVDQIAIRLGFFGGLGHFVSSP